MKALNAPTTATMQAIVGRFKDELLAGEQTEYAKLAEKRAELYPACWPGEWPEEAREPAIAALTVLYAVRIVGMCQTVTDEIADVAKVASETSEAREVQASMGFIQTVFHTWFESIDVSAIAEAVFEAGCEHERAAATMPAKNKNASTLIDELLAKYRPSNN